MLYFSKFSRECMPPFHHSKCTSIISLFPGASNYAKFRGGCRGPAKFDKGGGGVAIFFTFYALKISLFRVLRLVIKKGQHLRMLRYKKVPFLEFLCKAIKRFTFKNFYDIKISM